jgi:Tfp pilus assembly protein PilN
MSVNLIPAYVLRRYRYQRYVWVAATIAIAALIVGSTIVQNTLQRRYLAMHENKQYLQHQLIAIKIPANYQVIYRQYRRSAQYASTLQQRTNLLTLLHLIDKNSVHSVTLKKIHFANKKMLLHGVASNYDLLEKLANRLKKLSFIRDVQLNIATAPESDASPTALQFQMKLVT